MTVGDYLDDILAGDAPNAPEAPITRDTPVPVKAVRKQRFTVQIDPAIPEELRNAAVFLLMAGEQASVVSLVETALVSYIEQLRAEHCEGKPFPARPYGPPPGRRLLREGPAS